jgi:galactokinase
MDPFAGKGIPGDWGLGTPADSGLGTPGDWGRAGESFERAVRAAQDAFRPAWIADGVAVAPGRIELLGNHIDYNGGPVLAAAIDRFIVVVLARERGREKTLRAVAADAPDEAVTTLDAGALVGWRNASPPPESLDYVRGLLAGLQAPERSSLRPRLPASIAIAGDVPIGFGVSSSAALCVSLALALADGFSGPEEIVLLAQEAEHRAGTPCGTMDQSASVSGGVIAFDGATLGVERLSPTLGDLVFAVADSGVKRSLSTSSYPIRVAESRQALELAQRQLGLAIPHLAAITREQLEVLDHDHALPEPLLRRVHHVVEETARVAEGRAAMLADDWTRFGQLMTASGRSSATLYEISHPRVEELVAEALTVDGTLGARMMGGGEGGAVLVLISRDSVPRLEETLRSGYYARYGMAGRDGLIHICAFAPGATYIPIEGRSESA